MNASDLRAKMFVLRLGKDGNPLPGVYRVLRRECNGADLQRVDGRPRTAGFFTASRMRPATTAEVLRITGWTEVPELEQPCP